MVVLLVLVVVDQMKMDEGGGAGSDITHPTDLARLGNGSGYVMHHARLM